MDYVLELGFGFEFRFDSHYETWKKHANVHSLVCLMGNDDAIVGHYGQLDWQLDVNMRKNTIIKFHALDWCLRFFFMKGLAKEK
jgi:hypothetical protein